MSVAQSSCSWSPVCLGCLPSTSHRSLGWEGPLEKERLPTPIFMPGEFHGHGSLVGYSPWGHKELGMTKHNPSLLSGVLGTGLPGLGTEHLDSHPAGAGTAHSSRHREKTTAAARFQPPEKDLESPSSTRLEALVPSLDSRARTRSPSPRAWRPDFPGAAREAP